MSSRKASGGERGALSPGAVGSHWHQVPEFLESTPLDWGTAGENPIGQASSLNRLFVLVRGVFVFVFVF